jgi:hypothetical protein
LLEKSSGSHTSTTPSRRSLDSSGASFTRSVATRASDAEKPAASFHYIAAAAGYASRPAPAAVQDSSFSFTQGTSSYAYKAVGGQMAKEHSSIPPLSPRSSALSGSATLLGWGSTASPATRHRAVNPPSFYRNQVLLGPTPPVRGFLAKCKDSFKNTSRIERLQTDESSQSVESGSRSYAGDISVWRAGAESNQENSIPHLPALA